MLLDHLDSIIPRWMLDAANVQMSRLMATIASLGDAMVEGVLEARYASLPGQLDEPGGNGFDNFDALEIIAHDRGFHQGLLEDDFAFAARLRAWRDEWARSATPFELLKQLASILSPNPPLIRMFNGAGVWWELRTNGDIFQYTANGTGIAYQVSAAGVATVSAQTLHATVTDWDSAANPHPFGFGDASRFWIVVHAPCNGIYLAAISGLIGDGRFIGTGKGLPDATTIGTVAPSKEVSLIRNLAYEWRAAGLVCSHIIVAFDLTTFNPNGTSALYPDGTWGWPAKDVAGDMVPARDLTARYWRAIPGGVAIPDTWNNI